MADITTINLNGTALTIVDSAATSAIAGEIARAQGAESAITSALSAEVVARQSADTALETAISGKADSSSVYTKTEVDNKFISAATATTAEIASATSGLQATLTAGVGIDISSGNVISCTIDTGLYVVVPELPAEPAPGNENKIHLVPLASGSTGQNDYYEEYIWNAEDDDWEYLGTKQVEIDLSDYWTSAQTQSAITNATSGKVDTSAYTAYTAATDSALTAMSASISANTSAITAHTADTNNPHQVTAAQLGVSAAYCAQTETLILNIPASASPAPVQSVPYIEDSDGNTYNGLYDSQNGRYNFSTPNGLDYDTDWTFTLYDASGNVVTASSFTWNVYGDENDTNMSESNYAVEDIGYYETYCPCDNDGTGVAFGLSFYPSTMVVSGSLALGCINCDQPEPDPEPEPEPGPEPEEPEGE